MMSKPFFEEPEQEKPAHAKLFNDRQRANAPILAAATSKADEVRYKAQRSAGNGSRGK